MILIPHCWSLNCPSCVTNLRCCSISHSMNYWRTIKETPKRHDVDSHRHTRQGLGGCTPPPPPAHTAIFIAIFGQKRKIYSCKSLDFRASAGENIRPRERHQLPSRDYTKLLPYPCRNLFTKNILLTLFKNIFSVFVVLILFSYSVIQACQN